jgi:hypothetical protein
MVFASGTIVESARAALQESALRRTRGFCWGKELYFGITSEQRYVLTMSIVEAP